jgi:hypothetical protein
MTNQEKDVAVATAEATIVARAAAETVMNQLSRVTADEDTAKLVAREVQMAAMFAGGRAYAVKVLAGENENREDTPDVLGPNA